MTGAVETLFARTSGSEAAPPPLTLGAKVYAELCDRLIGGEIPPGEKVSLRHLADGLGTSVMPVREAVARLVADGALEVTPNRSVRVPVMTLSAFAEITEVRIAIEGYAAERAATLRRPADITLLRRADARFRHQCEREMPDAAAAMRANRDFHFHLYDAAQLPRLVKIIAGLWLQTGPLLNLDMRQSPHRLRMGGAEAQHAACLIAVIKGDGPGAREALVGDIRRAAEVIAGTGQLPG